MHSPNSCPLKVHESAPTSTIQIVHRIVFPRLQAKLPHANLQKQTHEMTREKDDTLEQNCYQNAHSSIQNALLRWILIAYRNNPIVSFPVADKVAEEVAEDVKNAIHAANTNTELHERLELAFTQLEYRGDACIKFREYVERCWEKYEATPGDYKTPYVALIQNSGFGKSRLLRELSLMTSVEQQGTMRVLYTCTRLGLSNGYPEATKKLREWLFGDAQTLERMTSCLEAISYYAQHNWEDIGTEWENSSRSQPLTWMRRVLYLKLNKRGNPPSR
ncbi:hypothetical protein PI125_g11019 [Phytophthora idaei]|nr:hypothetical protein PI125_g11019 [Phytophthora idaei]